MQSPIALTAGELDEALREAVRGFTYVDMRNIEEFTDSFCARFKLTGIPRDPWSLLSDVFGIEIRRMPADRQIHGPAMWHRDVERDRYVIEVSDHRLGPQGALLLLHEFWEIIASIPGFPTRYGSNLECELGNKFAVHFAMPEDAVREVAQILGHSAGEDKSAAIADWFCVSGSAARYRLRELGIGGRYGSPIGPRRKERTVPQVLPPLPSQRAPQDAG